MSPSTSKPTKSRSAAIRPEDFSPAGAQQKRLALFQEMTEQMGDSLSAEELDLHFSHMPNRYWARATSPLVRSHLELIHVFFASLGAVEADGTPPIVRWKHCRERSITEVHICTWDRLGLLAKVAGAFAAVGLNIIRADIFTRADNIVIDVFEVCEADGKYVRNEALLEEMTRLLTVSLKPDAVMPFISGRASAIPGETSVYFENERNDHYNALMVEAPDRVGLLYDVFTALSACDVNVAHAIITTDSDRVGDVFYVTDADGREITYPARLEEIRQRVTFSLQ